MNCHSILFAFLLGTSPAWLVPSMAADRQSCPVTRPSDPAFTPPAPYPEAGSREFLYGAPALWTIVYPDWHIHRGGKLPFFRQGYDWMKGRAPAPRLTVVARRLDREEPLVWNGWANNGFMELQGISFMVTGIDIPAAGCWEIAAHYVESQNNIQNLTYTVWVEPKASPKNNFTSAGRWCSSILAGRVSVGWKVA